MPTSLQRHPVGITWHESEGMSRAAHAVSDGERVWLIDPFEDTEALAAAAELGEPSAVIQLLDRHRRDGQAIASRLGVPLQQVPAQLPGTPFEVISIVSRPWWREVALWWPEQETLIVAEAVGTAPLFALGRPAGVHPMLRAVPPRSALGRFAPRRLLVGHGPALETGAGPALSQALSCARADIPRFVLKLPSAIRSGRS
jgi:hypothetical protein